MGPAHKGDGRRSSQSPCETMETTQKGCREGGRQNTRGRHQPVTAAGHGADSRTNLRSGSGKWEGEVTPMESRTAKEEGRSPRWRELGPVEREGRGKAATGFLRDTQARPLQPPRLLWEATVQPAVFSLTVLGGSKCHPQGTGQCCT